MKLRIRDNSLRLRLTRSEVEKIGQGQSVISSIQLGDREESSLSYCLRYSEQIQAVRVSFEHKLILVEIPKECARVWALGNDVGIYSEQQCGNNKTLIILIEKDFFCLKPRSHEQEDESDMFINPNAASGRCG